jgi:serine/threonine protein kinase
MALSLEDYDVGDFLGSGGFASVHRAYCRRPPRAGTGTGGRGSGSSSTGPCAIKILSKAVMQEHRAAHKVNNEIKVHEPMDHPNVVKLLDSFEDGRNVYMVLELCEGGNLFRYLNNTGPMAEDAAARVTRQILLAVAYMHGKGVVHRDLKLSNVLISDPTRMTVKICDFGLAVRLQHPDEEHFTLCGTPNYIAPEIAGQAAYGPPADLWAVGCLFYCMVTGGSPFQEDDVPATLRRILTGRYAEPASLSAQALDFLRQLLQMDPLKRASAQQICGHPFIAKCSAAAEDLSDIASRLAKAVALTGIKKKKKSKREVRSEGSFIRSSGDDTDLQTWRPDGGSGSGDWGRGQGGGEQRSGQASSFSSPQRRPHDPSENGSGSGNASMSSSRSAARPGRREAPSAGETDSHPRFLLASPSQTGAGTGGRGGDQSTVDFSGRPTQCASEPLSWMRALGHAGKGKAGGDGKGGGGSLSHSLSSTDRCFSNLAAATHAAHSLNSSVDSAASVAFCHGRADAARGTIVSLVRGTGAGAGRVPPSDPSSRPTPLPLLHLPPRQALMHRSANGDLLVCSSSGDVVFCSRVATHPSSSSSAQEASVLIRLGVMKRAQTKISLCRMDEGMASAYQGILGQSQPVTGFSFLSDSESAAITKSDLFSVNSSEKVFSIRGVPEWVALKYKKMHRVLETVKCRLPRFVLYVSSVAVLRRGREALGETQQTEIDSGGAAGAAVGGGGGGSVGSIDGIVSTGRPGSKTMYCKCMLMSNEPLPDFCVQWADGVKLRYSLASGRLHLSSPLDPPASPLFAWAGGGAGAGTSPSWTATAPDSVKEYLSVAQAAMQRCLEEQDQHSNFYSSSSGNNVNTSTSTNSSISSCSSSEQCREKVVFI